MRCLSAPEREGLEIQLNNTTIGMDIAKSTFHLTRLSRSRRVTDSVKLKRRIVSAYFAGIEPFKVAMEAYGGAHYWGRRLLSHGHDVVLLPTLSGYTEVSGWTGVSGRLQSVRRAESESRQHRASPHMSCAVERCFSLAHEICGIVRSISPLLYKFSSWIINLILRIFIFR